MGATNQDLAPSCPSAILKEGKRWNADASLTTLKNWAEQL